MGNLFYFVAVQFGVRNFANASDSAQAKRGGP